MIMKKYGFTIEVDIHGMNVREAKSSLERLLCSVGNDVHEIDVVHGYQNGQSLRNMVRNDLKHRRIQTKILSMNPGVTTLKLKELKIK